MLISGKPEVSAQFMSFIIPNALICRSPSSAGASREAAFAACDLQPLASIAALDVHLGVEAHRLAILLRDRDDVGILVLHGLEQGLGRPPLRHMAGGHRRVVM